MKDRGVGNWSRRGDEEKLSLSFYLERRKGGMTKKKVRKC